MEFAAFAIQAHALILGCLNPQLRNAKVAMETPESHEGVQVQLERDVWVVGGCVEFFQSLQFEPLKSESSPSWVTLTAPHTLLERKALHNAATAVMATFGECRRGRRGAGERTGTSAEGEGGVQASGQA